MVQAKGAISGAAGGLLTGHPAGVLAGAVTGGVGEVVSKLPIFNHGSSSNDPGSRPFGSTDSGNFYVIPNQSVLKSVEKSISHPVAPTVSLLG